MSENGNGSRRRLTFKGAPAWMLTFADMMTLLLCLFVMLLSFAKFDKTEFRRNTLAINQAFGISKTPTQFTGTPILKTITFNPFRTEPQVREENHILLKVKKMMAQEILSSMIDIEVKDNTVIIRFPGSAAFPSGDADLVPAFLPTLTKIGEVLKGTKGRIIVSGHTDDVPISTSRFRSNWDLSAARAVSVAQYLMDKEGLDPHRILVQGAADSQPLVPNNSPENRARNRRVEITLELPAQK